MRFKKAFILVAVLASATFATPDDYSTWAYSRNIFINTSPSGANTYATVTDFPLLVRLTPDQSDIFSSAQSDGSDIRFAKQDGTHLHYQIERWDATNNVAEIWVLVDAIDPGTTQSIRMYWGNSSADSSNGPAVFDTANGFAAVWHMNGTSNEYDATANGIIQYEGSPPGVDSSGAVGPARGFNGAGQYFACLYCNGSGDSSTEQKLNFQMTDNYSISAWVHPVGITKATNDGNAIVNKGDDQYALQAYSNGSPAKRWNFTTRGNGTYLQDTSMGSLMATIGGWHHLVGTYHGAPVSSTIAESLYYDGVLVDTLTATNSNTTGRITSPFVFIGVNGSSGTVRNWRGSLDEIEMSHVVRGAEWIKLAYATQKPHNTSVYFTPNQLEATDISVTQSLDVSLNDLTQTLDDDGLNQFSLSSFAQNFLYPGQTTVTAGDGSYVNLQPNDGNTFYSAATGNATLIDGGNITAQGNITADSVFAQLFLTSPACDVPDYVFGKEYKLRSVPELESYLTDHKHLPDVPGAADMSKGVNVNRLDMGLLKNVEELTLRVIDLNKRLDAEEARNARLEANLQQGH